MKHDYPKLKDNMGASLIRAGGSSSRKIVWRVKDDKPQPVRTLTIEEWNAKKVDR